MPKNQLDALVRYLKRHRRGITQWTAATELGILRLSERARELEAKGYILGRESLTDTGRYGHQVRVTKYRLIAEPVA